ncbi:MAG: transglutaminase domain-containing protein [Eubacteriales bacterium]|nr:transglutaminase domain-containing protein [Eubacteriales bacterium]
MKEYYYNYLAGLPDAKLRQRAYYLILQGLKEISPSFPVPKLDAADLTELFTFVRLDHPEIFYASGFTYSFYPQADSVLFTPEYLFKKKEILEHQNAISSRIRKLIRPVSGKEETEKELFVHDFICQNVRYDKLKKAYSHEIIGPLTQGVGVCEGIAKTVKILCDELNIPCIIAFCHNNPDKGIKYRHAWNIVTIGGKTVHLDATFDNTLTAGGDIRYDYFNTDDASLFRDHEKPVWPLPSCSGRTEFYYIKKKLSFTKYEDLRNRISQAAKKKKALTFHWRGSYLTRDVLKEISSIIGEEAEKRQLEPILSLNWPQAVFRITFSEKEKPSVFSEDDIRIEISNEGELN